MKAVAEDRVTIMKQVLRSFFPREGLDDLQGRPFHGGLLGHVEVDHPTPVVGEDDEEVKDSEGGRRDDAEIDRDQALDVVVEEDSPRLRWWLSSLRQQAPDCALRDLDSEFEELAAPGGNLTESPTLAASST